MSTVPAVLKATAAMPQEIDQREIDAVRRVLFFDGVCGLCNWSVDFVLKRDLRGDFQFAPLQGETSRALLTAAEVTDLHTVVLWVNGKTHRKSSAVVRVLWQLGPGWQILGGLLWLIPRPIRNLGYTIVAANRYRIFGKKETCRLPTPVERLRFLP